MPLPTNWVDNTGMKVDSAYLNELDAAVNSHTTALGSCKLWKGTAAQYAALGAKDANTIYVVTA